MGPFRERLNRYAANFLILGMLLTVIVKCVATAAGGNYLFADGANHLYRILQAGGAVTNIDGRQGSFFLMELLITLGMKLGITNINVLCALYGIGSVIWLGVFILLAMFLCKKHDAEDGTQYMAMLAVLYVLVNVFTGFFTAIESITAVGMYVFLLIYYMLSQKGRDWVFRIISAILLFFLPVANEYFVGYSAVLLLVLAVRMLRDRKQLYIVEWTIHFIVNIYTCYCSYLATTQGAPTSSLEASIRTLADRKYYWLLLGTIVVTLLVVVVYSIIPDGIFKKIMCCIVFFLCVLCSVWLGLAVYLIAYGVASISFSMRFMNLILPMAVGMFFLLLWLFRLNLKYAVLPMAILFLVLSCIYDVRVSRAYHDYLVRIHELNQEYTGFFEVGQTNLDRTFCWGWPLPMESLLAQCIQGETVIDSNMIYRFDMQQWEPFESDNIDAYGDLERYGIYIDKEAFR